MAVSRILSWMIIYLIPRLRDAPGPIRRRSDRFSSGDATYPRIFVGPAVLPLFCLAPHGVFRASRITPRAVSSYLAFSPLPALFSKNRRYVFCDTFRRYDLSIAVPAYFTRHAAVWCSDFPPASLATYQRSSAIGSKYITIGEAGKQAKLLRRRRFGVRWSATGRIRRCKLDTALDRRAIPAAFTFKRASAHSPEKLRSSQVR